MYSDALRTLTITAVCIGVVVGVANKAFATRPDLHPGCNIPCWSDFWSSATAKDVVVELGSEPGALAYRGHILQLAIGYGASADAVEALLRAGAPPNTPFEYCPRGDCGGNHRGGGLRVLHEAARRDAKVVSVLLDAGALPHLTDQRGRTPLHDAVEAGRTRAAAVLLGAGADPLAPDTKGATAMDLADRLGKEELRALLRSPRVQRPPCGKLCEPEFWRTATERQVWVQAPNARGRSPNGDAPLHLALAAATDSRIVEQLLLFGADPNARNVRDDTPLHVAARTPGDDHGTIHVLLGDNAMFDAANAEGWTPLHVASERIANLVMRTLLHAGANPNLRTPWGRETPLHLAVLGCRGAALRQGDSCEKAIVVLIRYGADPSIRDSQRATPLDNAKKFGLGQTIVRLLENARLPVWPWD